MQMAGTPKRVTPHGDKIRRAMESKSGVWLARSEIADLIGKNRLTPYDNAMLDLMADQHLIERRKKEGYSPQGFMWEYRAKTT